MSTPLPPALTSTIHVGATAPYAVKYTVSTEDPAFNLTLVTAARFDVLRGSGQIATWGATLSGATTSSLVLTHVFDASDVPDPDDLRLEPRLTYPGGELVCQVAKLTVRRKFE